jgi:DNA-binding beta-propeller fold protein YncE
MKERHKIGSFVWMMVIILCFSTKVFGATFEADYILDKEQEKIPIPVAYTADRVMNFFGEKVGTLNNPQDLFIDSSNNLYIVDTGNNRILRMTLDGKVTGVFNGSADFPLSEPNGIYVDEKGNMYIADTGNERVVVLSKDGKFIKEYTKPTSELYDQSYPFRPMKVHVDRTGYLYILNKDDYHGLIILDNENNFRGYIAPTKLEFSLRDLFIRLFATKEQKEALLKRLPPAHSNFLIHDDGMIYAATIRTEKAQIKKITPLGNNIYKKTDFFGEKLDDYGNMVEPMFVDLCVDKNGIITAIDASKSKIYQYDPEGNLLAVFGGYGTWRGKFVSPSSIVVDSEGNLYVLDASTNCIQVLKPTRFKKTVHYAIGLYYQGKYKEAMKPWKEILNSDPYYIIANKGLAKALMKQERWKDAMVFYKKAEDKEGYSQAFDNYRHENFKRYFLVYVLGFVLIVVGLYQLIKRLYQITNNVR